MTGFVDSNPELVKRNFGSVVDRANSEGIDVLMITSKREPMLNIDSVCEIADRFRNKTVEVQTNGIQLNKKPEHINLLYKAGVKNIAFSIDHLRQLEKYKPMFKAITDQGMTVRICINLTDMIPVEMGFEDIFSSVEKSSAKKRGKKTGNIRQLLFRNVSIPTNIKRGKQRTWIKKHTSEDRYISLGQEFQRITLKKGYKPLQILPFDGSEVWGHEGISVVFSDYCIQESNNTDDVRSLIYLEDGHLYTSWSDLASIIF